MKGLNTSDISAILGVNPYVSPLEVYFEKVGTPKKEKENERMYWAKMLKPVIREAFGERTGLTTLESIGNQLATHPDHDFLYATQEYLVLENGEIGLLDIRSTNAYNWKQFDREVPMYIDIQLQAKFAILELRFAYVACLIGGNKLKIHRVEANPVLMEEAIGQAVTFWNEHILKQVPPPLDGSKASTEFLKELYPESDDKEERFPDKVQPIIEKWKQAVEEYKHAEYEKTQWENQIKQMMGNSERAYCGIDQFEWKTRRTKRFNQKKFAQDHPELFEAYKVVSSSRQFRYKKFS